MNISGNNFFLFFLSRIGSHLDYFDKGTKILRTFELLFLQKIVRIIELNCNIYLCTMLHSQCDTVSAANQCKTNTVIQFPIINLSGTNLILSLWGQLFLAHSPDFAKNYKL